MNAKKILGMVLSLGVLALSVPSAPAQEISAERARIRELETQVLELQRRVGDRPALCSSLTEAQRNAVAVGYQCQTSHGAIFERVVREGFGIAWQDTANGVIWSDEIGRFTNSCWDENGIVVDSAATRVCVEHHGVLPLRADFEQGEAHGFREVLPNKAGRYFWASSVHPGASNFAFGYFGVHGVHGVRYLSYRNDYSGLHSVRCVARD